MPPLSPNPNGANPIAGILGQIPGGQSLTDGFNRAGNNGIFGLQTPDGPGGVSGVADAAYMELYARRPVGNGAVEAGLLEGRLGDLTRDALPPQSPDMTAQPGYMAGVRLHQQADIAGKNVQFRAFGGMSLRGPFGEASATTTFNPTADTEIRTGVALSGGQIDGNSFARADGRASVEGRLTPNLNYSASGHITATQSGGQTTVRGAVGAGLDMRINESLSVMANGGIRADTNGGATATGDVGLYREIGGAARIGAYAGAKVDLETGRTAPLIGLRIAKPF